jgi:hypothetical protein
LDTVFVVEERVALDDPKVCSKFLWANKPFLNQFPNQVYLGATFANPVNGMFSFFPTLPVHGNDPQPFPLPILTLPNYINPALMMHHKISKSCNVAALWMNIVDQVNRANLLLGLKS